MNINTHSESRNLPFFKGNGCNSGKIQGAGFLANSRTKTSVYKASVKLSSAT